MTIRLSPEDRRPAESAYLIALANERTFLAWQRAALGLLAAAVAAEFVPALAIHAAHHILGVALAAAGTVTSGMGLLRWKRVDRGASDTRSAP